MTAVDIDRLDDLWQAWTLDRRQTDRDHLIIHYRPLVEQVAGSMVARLSRSAEREEIAAYGILGLIDAVERFDHTLGVPFESYGQRRIKGAILDGIRGVAWEPRSVRVKAREVSQARAILEQRHRRHVTNAEVAVELHVALADVDRVLADMQDASIAGASIDTAETATRASEPTPFPMDIDTMRDALADAILALPDRERVVFTLFYGLGFDDDQEGLTLKAIGEMLGVSPVRINQILNDAIATIQHHMAGR